MATYYKSQSPIQSGEDFIYPITTADQIMKSDNSRRLEQAGLIVADNSTSLGGVAAEDYALKTDMVPTSRTINKKTLSSDIVLDATDVGALPSGATAADSSKLGGTAASEYLLHSDALTLDEISASEDLTGKVAAAEAVKQVKSDVDAAKTGYARIFKASKNNVSQLTLTIPAYENGNSYLFAVLTTDWGSGNSSGAIGTCSFLKGASTGTTGTCKILSNPDSIITSASTDRDTLTLTVTLKASYSYVKLMIIA